MKPISLIACLLACLIVPSSLYAFFWNSGKTKIDPQLVGVWEGETIREDGTVKGWTQTRQANGRYHIHFRYYNDGMLVNSYISEGKWWVQSGRFCEIEDNLTGQHFEYEWDWISDRCVQMTSVKRNPNGEESDGYSFSECLINHL